MQRIEAMSPPGRTCLVSTWEAEAREDSLKFKAGLGYIMDFRPGWVTGKFLSQKKIKGWGRHSK